MNTERLEDIAGTIASVLTEEELKALTEWLKEIRNGKAKQTNQKIKAAERAEPKH